MSITQRLFRSVLRNDEPGDTGGGDVPTQPSSPPNSDPSIPPQFDASGIFNLDGQFGEIGERYATDDVDADYINRHFKGKTPSEIAKTLKDNQTAARAKGVSYPGAEASEDDWVQWRKAAGVPESADQVMPEDFEAFQNATGWTPEVAQPVLDAMIKAGAPGPVITAAIGAVQQAAAAQIEAWTAEGQQSHEANVDEVRKAFGAETDARIDGGVVAAEKLGLKSGLTQEQIDEVKEGIREVRNPSITRMFANLADAIRAAAYQGPGAASMASVYEGPREEAEAIMGNPKHPMHQKFLEGDREVHTYLDDLLDKAQKLAG